MKKVYCLYREKKSDGYGIEEQRLSCYQFVRKHGWEISQEFFEKYNPDAKFDFMTI